MVGVGLGTWAVAAANYGTSSDPLITLTYINNKLTPELLTQFQKQLDAKTAEMNTSLQKQIQELEAKIEKSSGGTSFVQVNLQSGQSVSCSAGAEIMLRSGSVQAWSDLSDLTSGSALKQGEALKQNYMYLVPFDGGGVGAAGASTMLIRGNYKIN
jgi:hypothetical protein